MDRVLIRKSDGVPVEYQTGNAPLGSLLKNAISGGLDPDDYEEKYINSLDYKTLAEVKINIPERAARKAEKDARELPIRNRLKLKLGLTDKDLDDLISLSKGG